MNNNELQTNPNQQIISIPESVLEIFEKINELREDPFKMANKLTKIMSYINKRDNTLRLPNSQPIKLKEGIKAYEEAITLLKEIDPLEHFVWNEDISKIAQSHSSDIGCKGLIQHDPSDKLKFYDRFLKFGTFSELHECIDISTNDPTLITTNLLVCDGDPNRTNRDIILSPSLRQIGIGIANHSNHNTVVVISLLKNWKKRVYPSNKFKDIMTDETDPNICDTFNNMIISNKKAELTEGDLIEKYEKELDDDIWFEDCKNKKEEKQIIQEGNKVKIIKNTTFNFENGSKRKVIVSKTWIDK